MANTRKYSQEFKEEATNLVVESGYTQAEAARQLGVPITTLRQWLKKIKGTDKSPSIELTDSAKEMRALRKENIRLRQEVEILKKATAFFAKESS